MVVPFSWRRAASCAAIVLGLLASPAASAVTIDFESGTRLVEIGNTFAAQGVIFRNFLNTDGSSGPVFEGIGNLAALDLSRNPGTTFNVTAEFASPVSSVRVGALAPAGQKLIMTAFDAQGNVLGTDTTAVSPAPGTVFETLSLSDIGDIAVVRWETDGPTSGAPGIDDLVFFFAPSVVATPVLVAGTDVVAKETSLKASSPTTLSVLQTRGVSTQALTVGREIVGRLGGLGRGTRRGDAILGRTLRSGVGAGDEQSVPLSVWANVSAMKLSDDFVSTAFEADVSNLLLGVDAVLTERLLLGALVGYGQQDVETVFNLGHQDIDQYQGALYAGYLFGDRFSVDAVAGYTWLAIDQSRLQPLLGRVTSDVGGDRWYTAGNLNIYHELGAFLLDGSTGVLYAEDEVDGFTESNGLRNPSASVELGQWRIGGNIGYPYGRLVLFGNAFFVYDFERTEVEVGANQAKPSDDRTEFQLGAGLRYLGDGGVTASLEYTTVEGRSALDSESLSFNFRLDF